MQEAMRWWRSGQRWGEVTGLRGEDPEKLQNAGGPGASAEAPVKFLNAWFVYMCHCNDALA